jgi:phosphatidyl-myo-inositol alpha-mannosyltransferase
MKILLSTPFDFAYPGGVNDHVYYLNKELRRQGHKTRVLSPHSNNKCLENGHHVRIGRSIPLPANGSTARITLSPLVGKRVKEFLRSEHFDIVHLHEPLTPTLQLSVLRHSNAVNIATFHAFRPTHFGYNMAYIWFKPLLKYYLGNLHGRIAVSEPAKDFISQYFPGECAIVPNGINYEAYGPDVPTVKHLRSHAPTVLFVGRYNESRKGIRYLLEAMRLLQQRIANARLLVVGPGEPEYLQRTAACMGIRNVVIAGEVPKDELPSYYATCDVFCAPSTGRESFGIVLLEGMAAGKPVVATDIDGYRSVVRDGREGLLVEPRNPHALADAIGTLFSNDDLRRSLGMEGRKRARAFAWPAVARQVVECYQEAIERRAEARLPSPAAPSLFSGTRRP